MANTGSIGFNRGCKGAGIAAARQRPDRGTDRLALMAAEVVHDDDIALAQGWHQELPDPGKEADGIDRLSRNTRCNAAVAAQRGNEGQCLPVPVRHLGDQALATGVMLVLIR